MSESLHILFQFLCIILFVYVADHDANTRIKWLVDIGKCHRTVGSSSNVSFIFLCGILELEKIILVK